MGFLARSLSPRGIAPDWQFQASDIALDAQCVMDDTIAQFIGVTSAAPDRATQHVELTEGKLEQAIQLYFESDGVD